MRIYRVKNYDAMSRQAANIISAQIILKPDSVLGLATGSTPIGAYQQLIDRYRMGDLDFPSISMNIWDFPPMIPEVMPVLCEKTSLTRST